MGGISIPFLKKYRNVYVKGYNRFPYSKLKGRNIMYYTGDIICVTEIPEDFVDGTDFLFDCECEFPKWKELRKSR